MREDFRYKSDDGVTEIHAIMWRPADEQKPKAILQIAHGMAEYIGRYEEFAEFLVNNGFLVAGNDHLGHGASVQKDADHGYFGKDGNKHVIADMHQLRTKLQAEYPDIPYFMLGHSMGSFLLRQYLVTDDPGGLSYSHGLAGAIIMGTGWQPDAVLSGGKAICRMLSLFGGWHKTSKLVDGMAFGSYFKHIDKPKTRFDWLSTNEDNIRKYIDDPWCGYSFTLNGYYNMFTGMEIAEDPDLMAGIDRNCPLLFVSGTEDPVGGWGEQVRKTFMAYRENTQCQCDIKLYEGDRHEILNETDRQQVYEDLLAWMRRE